jgi:integral membrane sensor domain MASE1
MWFFWWMGDSIGVLLALPLVLNISLKKLRTHTEQYTQLLVWIVLFACCEF